MYFADYKDHTDAKLNNSLFWEYDLANFDFMHMRKVVIQRVIERGWPGDWYAMLNMYGEQEVKRVICSLSYLNDKDMNFVSVLFNIPLSEMKCFERKQSRHAHWRS